MRRASTVLRTLTEGIVIVWKFLCALHSILFIFLYHRVLRHFSQKESFEIEFLEWKWHHHYKSRVYFFAAFSIMLMLSWALVFEEMRLIPRSSIGSILKFDGVPACFVGVHATIATIVLFTKWGPKAMLTNQGRRFCILSMMSMFVCMSYVLSLWITQGGHLSRGERSVLFAMLTPVGIIISQLFGLAESYSWLSFIASVVFWFVAFVKLRLNGVLIALVVVCSVALTMVVSHEEHENIRRFYQKKEKKEGSKSGFATNSIVSDVTFALEKVDEAANNIERLLYQESNVFGMQRWMTHLANLGETKYICQAIFTAIISEEEFNKNANSDPKNNFYFGEVGLLLGFFITIFSTQLIFSLLVVVSAVVLCTVVFYFVRQLRGSHGLHDGLLLFLSQLFILGNQQLYFLLLFLLTHDFATGNPPGVCRVSCSLDREQWRIFITFTVLRRTSLLWSRSNKNCTGALGSTTEPNVASEDDQKLQRKKPGSLVSQALGIAARQALPASPPTRSRLGPMERLADRIALKHLKTRIVFEQTVVKSDYKVIRRSLVLPEIPMQYPNTNGTSRRHMRQWLVIDASSGLENVAKKLTTLGVPCMACDSADIDSQLEIYSVVVVYEPTYSMLPRHLKIACFKSARGLLAVCDGAISENELREKHGEYCPSAHVAVQCSMESLVDCMQRLLAMSPRSPNFMDDEPLSSSALDGSPVHSSDGVITSPGHFKLNPAIAFSVDVSLWGKLLKEFEEGSLAVVQSITSLRLDNETKGTLEYGVYQWQRGQNCRPRPPGEQRLGHNIRQKMESCRQILSKLPLDDTVFECNEINLTRSRRLNPEDASAMSQTEASRQTVSSLLPPAKRKAKNLISYFVPEIDRIRSDIATMTFNRAEISCRQLSVECREYGLKRMSGGLEVLHEMLEVVLHELSSFVVHPVVVAATVVTAAVAEVQEEERENASVVTIDGDDSSSSSSATTLVDNGPSSFDTTPSETPIPSLPKPSESSDEKPNNWTHEQEVPKVLITKVIASLSSIVDAIEAILWDSSLALENGRAPGK